MKPCFSFSFSFSWYFSNRLVTSESRWETEREGEDEWVRERGLETEEVDEESDWEWEKEGDGDSEWEAECTSESEEYTEERDVEDVGDVDNEEYERDEIKDDVWFERKRDKESVINILMNWLSVLFNSLWYLFRTLLSSFRSWTNIFSSISFSDSISLQFILFFSFS